MQCICVHTAWLPPGFVLVRWLVWHFHSSYTIAKCHHCSAAAMQNAYYTNRRGGSLWCMTMNVFWGWFPKVNVCPYLVSSQMPPSAQAYKQKTLPVMVPEPSIFRNAHSKENCSFPWRLKGNLGPPCFLRKVTSACMHCSVAPLFHNTRHWQWCLTKQLHEAQVPTDWKHILV